MEPSVIVAVISLLAAPIAAWFSWVLTKRKTDTDVGNSIVIASGEAVQAIKDVMDTLKIELAETKRELTEFKEQNQELERSLNRLHQQNKLLLEQNGTLAIEINALKRQVDRFSAHG